MKYSTNEARHLAAPSPNDDQLREFFEDAWQDLWYIREHTEAPLHVRQVANNGLVELRGMSLLLWPEEAWYWKLPKVPLPPV